jgi:cold shock protein
MIKGTVKFFSPAKGFGFITPEDGAPDVYFRASVLKGAAVSALKPGRQVSFVAEPKAKGPEATEMKLLEAPSRSNADRKSVRVYCDPSSPAAAEVLAAINDAGYTIQLHDFVTAPLSPELLKLLSVQLRHQGQSLVRRYASLFFELQLDDRFLGEAEFWTAIHEHPSLLDGPVISVVDKVRICNTSSDVRVLLGLERQAIRPKGNGIPPRMAAALSGNDAPPLADELDMEEDLAPASVTVPSVVQKPVLAAARKRKASPKPKGKATKKVAAKAKMPATKAPTKAARTRPKAAKKSKPGSGRKR